ncbi:glycosyltransferase [Flammeovirga kamogawensis]|uniref:Glycosyltransferase n=1 Tax=Flammeovirga kamogawensis TaxID=373891 RepID=A0ABX8GW04_9BACT|nr:glycosyltransferase [Flammeovirga kamogawensis]MBB6461218.1 glycosyltransferase involved in cell wall biosynthesis [Flammeovirga kamogawensis]QWG07779.1 glycosyltransferase [Flammeovirga kamogawensis]TRX69585.1 glycosyltransferase [Flammeovirga kamogawensis]
MKIVHVSTYPKGGAANAATRLHEGLLSLGVESKVLCRNQTADDINENYAVNPSIWFRRISTLIKNLKILPNVYIKDDNCENFSFPISSYRLEDDPFVQEADVVVLHWVGDFLDYGSFFKNFKKPVYWFLHDMNPFMGGFHYFEDSQIYRKYASLEKKFLKIKSDAYKLKDNISVIAPSKWLMNASKESDLLGRFKHFHLQYGINPSQLPLIDRSEAREHFKLPKDKKTLLFVSEKVSNRRKGAQLLIDALKKVDFKEDVSILIVGNYDKNIFQSKNIYPVGVLKTPQEMALAYSAADLFVLSSREDNLPNVMLESMFCGTPVMSFAVGGMKDVINSKNGILIDSINVDELATSLASWSSDTNEFNRENIRSYAIKQFDQITQAKKFKQILENKAIEEKLF